MVELNLDLYQATMVVLASVGSSRMNNSWILSPHFLEMMPRYTQSVCNQCDFHWTKMPARQRWKQTSPKFLQTKHTMADPLQKLSPVENTIVGLVTGN
jgi:hypothetical protein